MMTIEQDAYKEEIEVNKVIRSVIFRVNETYFDIFVTIMSITSEP